MRPFVREAGAAKNRFLNHFRYTQPAPPPQPIAYPPLTRFPDYQDLQKKQAFFFGADVAAILRYGVDLHRAIEVFRNGSKKPKTNNLNNSDSILYPFHLSLYAKQAAQEKQEALKLFATLPPTATCIAKDLLYVDELESGSGDLVKPDSTIQIRRSLRTLSRPIHAELNTKINLKEAIPGFQKGFAGRRVGSKLKLYIHPDWGYKNFSTPYGNAFLTAEAEILAADK